MLFYQRVNPCEIHMKLPMEITVKSSVFHQEDRQMARKAPPCGSFVVAGRKIKWG
jgi:hypothetical protein